MLSNGPGKGGWYLLAFMFVFIKGDFLVQTNKPDCVIDTAK